MAMFSCERDRGWFRSTAGALIVAAGAVLFMGMITAEALFPGYHVGDDTISHLAAAEPSATVFNATMIVAGSLYVLGALLFNRCDFRWWISIPTMLMGVGAIGVGIFPYYTGSPHVLFAALAFTSGAAAAVLSSRILQRPFKQMSFILGMISFCALVIFVYIWAAGTAGPLGEGGLERWVAYPEALWALSFGGYLMGGGAKVPIEPSR